MGNKDTIQYNTVQYFIFLIAERPVKAPSNIQLRSTQVQYK